LKLQYDERHSKFALKSNLCRYTTGSSFVERPVLAPKPKMVVRAPMIVSVCDDYVIDLSGSYGTAGRQLNFYFGIYPNVPNEHVISEMLVRYSEAGAYTRPLVSSTLSPF